MSKKKLKVGDRVIDSIDRVGRVIAVKDDGSVTVDLTSQYWDEKDKVISHTFVDELEKLD